MRAFDISMVRFNADGLVPVVVQSAVDSKVLMLAWSNRETLLESLELGQMVYFSRSRDQRWHKGETSGNFQTLISLSLDCDGDTVLALVEPMGPACHNGTTTCFEGA